MAAPTPMDLTDTRRDRNDRVRVLADQVDLLYRQSPLGIVVTLIIGTVLAFELYSSAKIGQLVVFWAALTGIVSVARYFLVLAYRHAQNRDTAVIQLKLDELILSSPSVDNHHVQIERAEEDELETRE